MRNFTRRAKGIGLICLSMLALSLATTSLAMADEPRMETPSAAPQKVQEPIDTGDNAWMLTSSALVLLMTAPGLAMFYCGLVRKKNVVGVIMQCICMMGIMGVIWALFGYSLSFGGEGTWFGNGDYLFLNGVQAEWTDNGPVYPVADSIPRLTHMLFQGMFIIITPALIVGAFAERMKFSTMVVFMILWSILVYCPLCHWVWTPNGILAYGSPNAGISMGGALDFAGGTVVHISSGISALICALLIGKRLGYGTEPMPPHNLTYTAIGAALLWFGWFGFNGGSALQANALAASAFAATHFAAAAGAVTWAGMEWIFRGKPTLLGACSGLVAGLVCITPASGFVQPITGLIFGIVAGVCCFLACTKLKSAFGYDDSLDVFGVHGMGGTIGAILTGVFATRAVNDMAEGAPLGLFEGGSLLLPQIAATVITWIFAIVVTFVLLKILDATMGLRVEQEQEIEGLDLSQHNEEGYLFDIG